MEDTLTLPEGVRRMVVLALEVRAFDDETFRFIRTDVPPCFLGPGKSANSNA